MTDTTTYNPWYEATLAIYVIYLDPEIEHFTHKHILFLTKLIYTLYKLDMKCHICLHKTLILQQFSLCI